MALTAVYDREDVDEETAVSPPRENRATDLSKTSVPIAWVVAIAVFVGGFGVSQALSMAAMRSDVRDILTRMEYEAKMREGDAKLLDARFAALDAQITSSGLRNAALGMTQQIDKLNRK